MLDNDDLVLCAGSVLQVPFMERLPLAAASGFTGVSMLESDYTGARAKGYSDADLRAALAAHGLEIAELDALTRWLPVAESFVSEEWATTFGESDFYAIADSVGARSINLVDLGKDTELSLDVAAEAFAGVCDRAGEHGLLVHIEFLPWSSIPTLERAWEIVREAGRANGGVLLDTWHFLRSGGTPESLPLLPAARVFALQISDAPAQAEPDPLEETMKRRLLPGQGAARVREVVDILVEGGCTAPVGVEVFSTEQMALPADHAISRVAQASRAALGRESRRSPR
jgi:sugar phosphate isomerase/epimerase